MKIFVVVFSFLFLSWTPSLLPVYSSLPSNGMELFGKRELPPKIQALDKI